MVIFCRLAPLAMSDMRLGEISEQKDVLTAWVKWKEGTEGGEGGEGVQWPRGSEQAAKSLGSPTY